MLSDWEGGLCSRAPTANAASAKGNECDCKSLNFVCVCMRNKCATHKRQFERVNRKIRHTSNDLCDAHNNRPTGELETSEAESMKSLSFGFRSLQYKLKFKLVFHTSPPSIFRNTSHELTPTLSSAVRNTCRSLSISSCTAKAPSVPPSICASIRQCAR